MVALRTGSYGGLSLMELKDAGVVSPLGLEQGNVYARLSAAKGLFPFRFLDKIGDFYEAYSFDCYRKLQKSKIS
ncbi:hypothetical protein D3C78_1744740 [compost metagenome]